MESLSLPVMSTPVKNTVHLAIFASGSGSNAENIALYFRDNARIQVSLILASRPDAYVIERARRLGIPCTVFDRRQFYESGEVQRILQSYDIDLIILAGFLWLLPDDLIQSFPRRIINIHPALLPKYGGKGMYGEKVHRAVRDSGDTVTGITIHYVNEKYDEGEIVFQATCKVTPEDTPENIAAKVHTLEYEHFPRLIEQLASSFLTFSC